MLTTTQGFAIGGAFTEASGWRPLNKAVAGRQLLHTADGGATWSAVNTQLSVVHSVHFVNAKIGWIAGPEGIAATVDGGATWTVQLRLPDDAYQRAGTATWGAQVIFFDEHHGFALYRSADTTMSKSGKDLYATVDGGAHWRLQSSTVARPWDIDASDNPGGGADGPLVVTGTRSIEWLSASIGSPGTFLVKSADAGRTWTAHKLPFNASGVGDLSVVGQTRWVALADGQLGSPAPRRSTLLRSDDGGVSWTVLR
jgi:photosystem II stability/assembly factor-like uncharacterized protein